MIVVLAWNGRALRFPDERWQHIVDRHPNPASERDRTIETIRHPDRVQLGYAGERLASRRYSEAPFDGNHLVVVYLEEGTNGGFVVTAYLTRRLSVRRSTLWTRSP